ncbi:metal-dependent hydrolase [Acidipila sp. EB88]|nr:metal-dependent hydrolase [Acidipila sp. EB88]
MEPVTHFLTGACLGRSGFNRRTAYATLTMCLAAEAPDIDVLFSLGGPVTGFAHHRGITHTLVGAPFMALAVVGVVWCLAALGRRLGRKPPAQPVRWLLLFFLALLADFSHLLLDFTNNYGIRPFAPFNPHWYAWSIVFIFEPLLFAALLLALVLPALFGLIDNEVRRAPQSTPRSPAWAIAALCFVVLLYAVRSHEHTRAIAMVHAQHAAARGDDSATPHEPLLRVAAEPVMVNPFTWHTIAATATTHQSATAHTREGLLDPAEVTAIPRLTPAITAARASYLGRVYGDWSSWPVIEDIGDAPPPDNPEPLPPGAHTVVFSDLRFSRAALGPLASDAPPLSGYVVVGSDGAILAQWINGRRQR